MLIGLYFLFKEIILPELARTLTPIIEVGFEYMLVFVIIIAGISILFSSIGIRTSGPGIQNQLFSALLNAISFIARTAIDLVRFIVRTYIQILKAVFNSLKNKNLALAWVLTILVGIIIV